MARPLANGIVTNAADAARVGDYMRLVPMVLLRDVPAVQAAFAAWHARMIHEEATSGLPPPPEAVDSALAQDVVQLTTLVQELGLARYRWLPRMLRFEFQRALEHADRVEVTLPSDLPWAEHKPNPKRHEGLMGGHRLEDPERNVTWFVACEVLHTPKRRYAIEHHISRTTLQSAIKRVEVLLDCIDRPLPNPHVS